MRRDRRLWISGQTLGGDAGGSRLLRLCVRHPPELRAARTHLPPGGPVRQTGGSPTLTGGALQHCWLNCVTQLHTARTGSWYILDCFLKYHFLEVDVKYCFSSVKHLDI